VVGGPIVLSGVETLTVNGSDGAADSFTVLGYGAPTDVKTLNLNGGDTNNDDGDTIAVSTTSTTPQVDYTATGPSTAQLATPSGPGISVQNFNNAAGNLTVSSLTAGGDGLVVHGSTGADAFVLRNSGGFQLLTQ